MKKSLTYLFLILFISVFACKKDDTPIVVTTPDLSVSTILLGENQVPTPVKTSATGSVAGSYNKTTKILKLTVTFKDIVPFGIHIHQAPLGKLGGGIIFDFGTAIKSPASFMKTLSASQEVELMAGNYYVNLHTDNIPDGEIRGNLTVK
jgi:hypothetical protein